MEQIYRYDCTGCGACQNVCPVHCISMCQDQEGFPYPKIDAERCTGCGLCRRTCPETNRSEESFCKPYAMYAKDEDVRRRSSSGGFFFLLAAYVLESGGIVFGVRMERETARFCWTDQIDGLRDIQGSKYLQADTGHCYSSVKSFLEAGRPVLFSGTPCQVAALYRFLGREYDGLITFDFICHGVSSPEIFKKYLRKTAGTQEVERVEFRNKALGWREFSMRISFQSGEVYARSMKKDVYLQSFLRNLNLRPSCFFCRFREKNRISDFTGGDFWGCEYLAEKWRDDRGYSVVIVHSKKGEKLLEKIWPLGSWDEIRIDDVTTYNSSYTVSPWDLYSRNLFFKYTGRYSLEKSIEMASKNGIRKKAGRKWLKWKMMNRKKSKETIL